MWRRENQSIPSREERDVFPLLKARVGIEDFTDDHHHHRHRHESLATLTPAEYAAKCTHVHQPVTDCEIDRHQ